MKKRKAILSKHFTLTVPPNINFYLSFKKIKIKNRNFRNSPLCYLQNQLVPRATTGPKSGPSVPKTAKRHPLHTTRYQVSVHLHFSKSQKSYEKVLKTFDFRTFFGARAHFRTRSLIGRRTVYLPNIDMTGFFKIHSRHTAMLLCRWKRYFFVLLQISILRFYTNIIHRHQAYRFPRRLLPRSYRLPPD